MNKRLQIDKARLFLTKKERIGTYFPKRSATSVKKPVSRKSSLFLFFKKKVLASFGFVLSGNAAMAQTANGQGYFMPPAGNGVTESRPVPQNSPVIDDTLIDNLPPPAPVVVVGPLPWYETDWGVLGIGVVATAASLTLDHGVNQFAQTRLSLTVRKDYALKFADTLELAPLAFAGLTMVQSPISDPELAHASSIAFTSAAEVTVLTMGIKYVVGRDRPGGPDSNPFVAQPADAAHSTFSIGAVFPGFNDPTSAFPSGHTALAFALVTPYAEIYHQPWLYAIPVAVGVGRIAAVDGHWLSDVVGGGFVGWLTADLTRRYFPNSDYGLMIFGDGQQMQVGFSGRF
jgi:membrane-associated phospholipid phosphatase